MKKPTKKYTDERILELKGQIQESVYAKDVQDALKKWKINKTLTYIVQVVNLNFYNERVWDAVVKVLAKRKKDQEDKDRQVEKELNRVAELVD